MTELEVFTPEEANGVTALVFSGEGTLSAADRALCERFAVWGAQALAAPLSREGEVVSDRDATSLATAALKEALARDDVDPELLVLAGLGRGGTLAVLCACRADGAACVLDLGGPLIYRTLDESRSVQPLEMLLNLSAPLFMAFGEEVSEEERGWVEQTLSQFARTYNIEPLSAGGDALFSTDEAATETTWEAATAFLQLHLETP